MTDKSHIQSTLESYHFVGYAEAFEYVLSAYGIVQLTIDRINSKLKEGANGPFFVYRRAAIFCETANFNIADVDTYKESYPLVIVFRNSGLVIHNKLKGELECTYENLPIAADYLNPLRYCDVNRNDHYITLDLASLVSSLYRELRMTDNLEEVSRSFIFSLLYIAHITSLLDIEEVKHVASDNTIENERRLNAVFNLFQKQNCPFCALEYSRLTISKEAFKYIFAIINFDTNNIDSEILTSLLYRIADKDDAGLYGHKTSSINIGKLLQSLFLDKLQEQINNSTNSNIFQLVTEIYDITILDPTNSPGCFLVAAYNGLLQLLRDTENRFEITCHETLDLHHFIGLVKNDFTKELTKIALLFTHSRELKRLSRLDSIEEFNKLFDELAIYVVDELNTSWSNYALINENLYIVGSPEFKGYNRASVQQKNDMSQIFKTDVLNNADYCSTWLIKAAETIKGSRAKAAFVLTNSVAQGSQASFILDKVNENGCEYFFAYTSFKWKISDEDNSGVTVVIIGIAASGNVQQKAVNDGTHSVKCQAIGPTLLPNIDIRIRKRKSPLGVNMPPMRKGNMPDKAIALTFTSSELDDFLDVYPNAESFIRPLYGGDEFVKSMPRWVLWINDKDLEEAVKIEGIRMRIEEVRKKRTEVGSTSSQKSIDNPHKFRETNCTSEGKISVVVPCVTSERREYFQMGILGDKAIVNNNINVIFDCDLWVLALLESRMHMVWAKNAAGGHETRPRYSSELCYNTFPVPQITRSQKASLTNLAKTLLEVREKYCDKSLADLYNNMPPELIRIHHLIDETVDSIYRNKPFENNEERLIWLEDMYNNLTNNE